MSTIYILDDDTSFRRSTSRLLRACGYAVETFETADQLLSRLPDDPEVRCILLDIKMPGMSGPELQSHLNAAGSAVPIIFLTGHADIPTTVDVIKAGAENLLTKPVQKVTLVGAIERALARVRLTNANHEQLGPLRALISRLSPRERQVFERVVRGRTNKEIARDLGTSERTVKAHRHRVMEKVKVTSLAELVMIAERLGLLSVANETGAPERAHAGSPGAR